MDYESTIYLTAARTAKQLSSKTQMQLYTHAMQKNNTTLLTLLAKREDLDGSVLNLLSKNKSAYVTAALISRKGLSTKEAKELIAKEKRPTVLAAIAEGKDLATDVLDALRGKITQKIARIAIENPNASDELFIEAALLYGVGKISSSALKEVQKRTNTHAKLAESNNASTLNAIINSAHIGEKERLVIYKKLYLDPISENIDALLLSDHTNGYRGYYYARGVKNEDELIRLVQELTLQVRNDKALEDSIVLEIEKTLKQLKKTRTGTSNEVLDLEAYLNRQVNHSLKLELLPEDQKIEHGAKTKRVKAQENALARLGQMPYNGEYSNLVKEKLSEALVNNSNLASHVIKQLANTLTDSQIIKRLKQGRKEDIELLLNVVKGRISSSLKKEALILASEEPMFIKAILNDYQSQVIANNMYSWQMAEQIRELLMVTREHDWILEMNVATLQALMPNCTIIAEAVVTVLVEKLDKQDYAWELFMALCQTNGILKDKVEAATLLN